MQENRLLEGENMKSGVYVVLALVILATTILLPADSYAGGRHWHGHHHGSSFHLGLGFVFPIYSNGYPYGRPYGYPYYGPPPAYPEPAQSLPPVTQGQPSYSASQEQAEYCREYTKTVLVDGKEETAYGTACLQDDGRWRIMN